MTRGSGSLQVRPYQLMCAVCSLGAGNAGEVAAHPRYAMAKAILATLAAQPDVPVTLRCQAGHIYAYQDPGTDEDTPEGSEYNRKRDLDILQRLDLVPGATLPARTLLMRLLSRIPVAMGICGYREVSSEAWRGCARATSGSYERGVARGIDAIIPPRDEDEMERQKRESGQAICSAEALTIRPHILLCNVCHFGGRLLRGEALPLTPIVEDNVVEFLERVLNDPDVPVVMARGADPMICAPCPRWVPEARACTNVTGSGGLANEKRDLDVLQRLGLTYGARMHAADLYRLVFARIPTVADICVRDNPAGADRQGSVWDSCDYQAIRTYEAGRLLLMGRFERQGSVGEAH